MSHAWHNKLLLPSVNSKFRIYQLGFGGKLCAATTPPHGGAGRSRPRITNALACHLGQAVHLGRPAGSLLSPIHKSLWKLSRKNALGAGAARPFGPARLHGRKRRYFPASTYARSLSVYLRRCSSCRPRPAAEKAANRTRGRRYTMSEPPKPIMPVELERSSLDPKWPAESISAIGRGYRRVLLHVN